MIKNRKTISLLFLVFLVAIILSACSFSWPDKNYEEIKPEIELNDDNIESEIEDSFSNRLKVFSEQEKLKTFLKENKFKASYLEEEQIISANYLSYNNQGVYSDGNDLASVGDNIFFLNKNKLKIINKNSENEYNILSENEVAENPDGMIVVDSKIIIYGQENNLESSYLKIFEFNLENNLSLVKEYKFSGKKIGLIEKQDYIYFIFESTHEYQENDYYPNILENEKNIFLECENNENCWDTFYFDTIYENYRFLGVASIDLNNINSGLTGQFYLLNNNQKVRLTNNSFYIAHDLRLNTSSYTYQAKEDIIFPNLSENDKLIVSDIKNSSLDILSEAEKKEKINLVFDNYLNSLLDTDRILLEADISDLVNETVLNNDDLNNQSILHRFTLDGQAISYYAKQTFKGYLNSIDKIQERDGRVDLSTHMQRFDENGKIISDYTNLYILNNALEIQAKMEKLGTNNDIYSISFIGDRIFLLSKEEAALIYVIDSSDLANLNFLGSIKLNGFENYLQVLDDNANYFIGLSKYKNEENINEIKLSLYDFIDLKNPKELDSYLIGDNLTDSFVFKNPNSFYFLNDTISFPLSLYDGNNLSFSGAFFFTYINNNLEYKGRVDHSATGFFNQSYTSLSTVKRENTVLNFLEKDDTMFSFSAKFLSYGKMDNIENSAFLSLSENTDDLIISSLESLEAEEDDLVNEEKNSETDNDFSEDELFFEEDSFLREEDEDIYDQFEIVDLPSELNFLETEESLDEESEEVVGDSLLNDNEDILDEIIYGK